MRPSWSRRVLFGAVLLLTLFYALRQNTDYDLGFHLHAGRILWEQHRLPVNTDFVHTVGGAPYHDAHWLYQIVLYGTHLAGGPRLLTLLNALVLLGTMLLFLALLERRGTPPVLAAALATLVLVTMEMRAEIRPETFSWFFLTIVLRLLDLHRDGNPRARWYLPLVTLVWANMHSLFILSPGLLALALLGGRGDRGRWDLPLAMGSAAALAACFVTPYGLGGFLYPFRQWAMMAEGNVFAQNISELMKPWPRLLHPDPTQPLGYAGLYHLFAPAFLGLLLWPRRGRNLTDLLTGAAFFVISTTAVRNIPLFMLAVAPITARRLGNLREDGWKTREHRFDPWAAPLAGLLILLMLRVVTGAQYASERRLTRFGWGLSPGNYPERCADFILANRLEGLKPLNDIPVGNWLLWRCRMKVFIDGRLESIPPEVFGDYLGMKEPGGFRRAADKYQARLLAVDPQSAYVPVPQLEAMPGWVPVFLEESCILIAPPDVASKLPPLDWAALLSDRGILPPSPGEPERLLSKPAISPLRNWSEGFYRRKEFPFGLWNLAGVAAMNGRMDVAETLFLEILRRTEGIYPEVYGYLGRIYRMTGRRELADLCSQRSADRE